MGKGQVGHAFSSPQASADAVLPNLLQQLKLII
jgi:hypothetical protein